LHSCVVIQIIPVAKS